MKNCLEAVCQAGNWKGENMVENSAASQPETKEINKKEMLRNGQKCFSQRLF